ncbi:apolipoprotein A-IV-like isoform X2 [Anguilla anguilla]|uniref:apolipoprotein A-IV-like isoform X2 n=1 Tax=Anguilla anguilla TaxID=7936 RepID=UPI0015B0D41F|nr:apolipoprotein A-IV-like isoform X2 [Anguilla anguilla]XP_035278510.1 apolipoprotein A-IV-like isoform X2 [Anguilla anguilla]
MKLFVVLALVAFTGCQANVLRSDKPTPQLELVKDAFWDYFVKASQKAQGALKTIRESELAQQVNAKIKESVEVAQQYRKIVQEQVIGINDELHKKLSEHVEQLSESMQPDINEVRVQLEPLAELLRANIQQQMQKVRQVLDPYTESLDIRALERALRRMHWTLSMSAEQLLSQLLEHLHSQLGPSTEELKGKVEESMQEYREFVLPLEEILKNEIFNKLSMFFWTVYPYADSLTTKLDPYIQGLESQLTALWESSAKSA